MIGRRKFLSWLGLAPVVAVVAPPLAGIEKVPVEPLTPRSGYDPVEVADHQIASNQYGWYWLTGDISAGADGVILANFADGHIVELATELPA